MKLQKFRVSIILSLLFFTLDLTANNSYDINYENLRTAVYNSTVSTENDVTNLYNEVMSSICDDNSIENNIKFSQCDYLMGLFYIDYCNIPKAINYFETFQCFAMLFE